MIKQTLMKWHRTQTLDLNKIKIKIYISLNDERS